MTYLVRLLIFYYICMYNAARIDIQHFSVTIHGEAVGFGGPCNNWVKLYVYSVTLLWIGA
jgi:hypothetical protein